MLLIDPVTTVVNLRLSSFDIKVTRTYKNDIPPPPAFGCFGNPFSVEEFGREKCLELFDAYFFDRIEKDPEWRAAVLWLKGKKIGCLCWPLRCHADRYKAWLDEQPAMDLPDSMQEWITQYVQQIRHS